MICSLRVELSKPEGRKGLVASLRYLLFFYNYLSCKIDTFSSRIEGLKLRVVTGLVRVVAQALLAFSCLWSPSLQVRRPCNALDAYYGLWRLSTPPRWRRR